MPLQWQVVPGHGSCSSAPLGSFFGNGRRLDAIAYCPLAAEWGCPQGHILKHQSWFKLTAEDGNALARVPAWRPRLAVGMHGRPILAIQMVSIWLPFSRPVRGPAIWEPPIEVTKPQEDLDLMIWLWLWPFLNGGDPTLVHGHSVGGHHEPQEFDFGGEEIILLQTCVQPKASKTFDSGYTDIEIWIWYPGIPYCEFYSHAKTQLHVRKPNYGSCPHKQLVRVFKHVFSQIWLLRTCRVGFWTRK